MTLGPEHRLAVYGSLAPGERNHDRVAHLAGKWFEGTVRGHLRDRAWGAGIGFPALIPDPAGDRVPVQVLESPALPAEWDALDAFEGEEYRRVVVTVDTEARGPLRAQIYALASAEPNGAKARAVNDSRPRTRAMTDPPDQGHTP